MYNTKEGIVKTRFLPVTKGVSSFERYQLRYKEHNKDVEKLPKPEKVVMLDLWNKILLFTSAQKYKMHNQMVFETKADKIRKKNLAGPETMENLLTGKSVNIFV